MTTGRCRSLRHLSS